MKIWKKIYLVNFIYPYYIYTNIYTNIHKHCFLVRFVLCNTCDITFVKNGYLFVTCILGNEPFLNFS